MKASVSFPLLNLMNGLRRHIPFVHLMNLAKISPSPYFKIAKPTPCGNCLINNSIVSFIITKSALRYLALFKSVPIVYNNGTQQFLYFNWLQKEPGNVLKSKSG